MFVGVVADWNPSQVALAYWFSFYDSVYEHPDRPPIKVINNDDLLDKWVEDKGKELEDRAKKENGKYGSNMPKGALSYDEVIVFDDADDEYYDELMEDHDGKTNYEFDGADYE